MSNILYLLAFFISKVFADGKFIIPIAAWLAPFFLIRFLRHRNLYICLPIGLLFSFIGFCISWYKMIPLDLGYFLLLAFGLTLNYYIPYIVDRLVYKKIKSFLSTLILPLLFVMIEYLGVLFSPYGTWGIIANTQFDNKVILQIVSVTGVWGITFMIYWFATTLNWMIDNKFQIKIIKPAFIYFSILFLVIAFGSIRTHILKPQSKTVKIIGMYNKNIENFIESDTYKNVYKKMMRDLLKGNPIKQEDIEKVRKEWLNLSYSILPATEKQAIGGAKFISWAEVSTFLLKDDEKEFLNKCGELARKYKIYFQVGLWTVDINKNKKPAENRLIIFNPEGKMIEDYHKYINLPGYDAKVTKKGTKKAGYIKTPFGTISIINCFENAFPNYIRKISKADIVLSPSKDWKAVDPYNTIQLGVRAVENGFSVVRPTALGLSASYDYQGNVISKVDFFKSNSAGDAMISYVPIKGVTTIYSIIGDLFAWLSFAGFIFIILWNIVIANRRRK